MNLKAFLWFVYKLKFHVIAALAFNVNKIHRGVCAVLSARGRRCEPRAPSHDPEQGVLSPEMGAGQRVLWGKTEIRLAKPHRLPGRAARRNPSYPWLSPFELRAKSKVLEMVPSFDDHPWTPAVLWSPVSFVLGPSLGPSGGRVGNLIAIPPSWRAWAPDTCTAAEPRVRMRMPTTVAGQGQDVIPLAWQRSNRGGRTFLPAQDKKTTIVRTVPSL